MEIRSFLACELPREIRAIVAQILGELSRSSLKVRWVKPNNIHLTVIFLGNIFEDAIPDIKKRIQYDCQEFGSFQISLKGMGCFPNRRNPRVLWLGLEGDIDRMGKFRDSLQRSIAPFGIKMEKRPFRPHLTLGRFKKRDKINGSLEKTLSKYENLTSPVCQLQELILFKSILKPSGAEYTKLGAWALLGKG
jgi:2'-5' RNA ligase